MESALSVVSEGLKYILLSTVDENIFDSASSSSESNVDHYITIRKLLKYIFNI
jgi:hypothetical protein